MDLAAAFFHFFGFFLSVASGILSVSSGFLLVSWFFFNSATLEDAELTVALWLFVLFIVATSYAVTYFCA